MIHEQKISSIMRHYPDGAKYGEAYDYVWNVIYHNPTTIEIVGVHVAPTLKMTRDLIAYLRSIGIREMILNRKGRIVTHYLVKE